ncbi:diacylglycerol O-acyltransferase 2-like protein [Carex littledalei]|uniref:Acyltransferase n=1 Tax=Carex littledalei TaxID=544730 RepID=A0A833R5I0_9POAL|nr:diacylglycerol O-acyltransferase 2-like protein [Carex littledalei]
MTEANGEKVSTNGTVTESKETVFTGTEYSGFKTMLSLAIWLGGIHFNVVLVLLELFVLPPRIALMVLAVQLFFMVIPIDDKSKLGSRLCGFICKCACGYFPATLHLEDIDAFDPKKTYVFGFEPHSVLPIGICALSDLAGFMPLPKTVALASSAVFWTPFLRQIWTWMGLVPASRKSFYSNLARGNNCVVIPGGVQEMLYMDSTSEVAFLKARKGFVKVAIEMGCPLVPAFCFGQSHIYKWWRPEGKIFVKISRAIKFTPLVFWGRWGTPIPYRVPMHVVVGTPIKVRQNPQPTYDEINEVHAQFLEAMEKLFDKYKGRVGYEDLPLRIL